MYIYWLDKQERRGPVTVPDVLSMIRLEELSWDTLGWHSGCSGWMPLRELPALSGFAPTSTQLPEESPLPSSRDESSSASSTEGGTTRPARRHIVLPVGLPVPFARAVARATDCVLYATLLLGIIFLLEIPYKRVLLPGYPLFWILMPVLEAICISIWHTTPGKRWLGIAFVQGEKINFLSALGRSFYVFVFGMGCMIPLFMIMTLPLSYFDTKRRGLARWDLMGSPIPVVVAKLPFGIIFLVIPFILLCLQLCSYFMLPWLPDMLTDLQNQDPEVLNFLTDWLSHS